MEGLKNIHRHFVFHPNTQQQNEDITEVFEAAQKLAHIIALRVPQKHGEQALIQLAQTVQLCRQGIELEPQPSKLVAV